MCLVVPHCKFIPVTLLHPVCHGNILVAHGVSGASLAFDPTYKFFSSSALVMGSPSYRVSEQGSILVSVTVAALYQNLEKQYFSLNFYVRKNIWAKSDVMGVRRRPRRWNPWQPPSHGPGPRGGCGHPWR